MPLCSFSSNDWKCDVCVSQTAHGDWTIDIAARRHISHTPIPTLPAMRENMTRAELDEWEAAYRAQRIWLDEAEMQPIELEHAGQRWTASSAGECADMLGRLRATGYGVPQGVIDSLREDQAHDDEIASDPGAAG